MMYPLIWLNHILHGCSENKKNQLSRKNMIIQPPQAHVQGKEKSQLNTYNPIHYKNNLENWALCIPFILPIINCIVSVEMKSH